MTLPSSGVMTAGMVNVELGRSSTAPFNMNGTSERTLAGVPAGAYSMSNFYGKTASGGGGKSEAYLGTFTGLTGVSFGTAAANRRIVVAIHWEENAGAHRTITSASIGGIGATIHNSGVDPGGIPTFGFSVGLISAAVPTGTSGNIVVNFSGASANIQRLGLYALYGYSGAPTAVNFATVNQPSDDIGFSLNAGSDGTIIAAFIAHRNISSFAMSLNGVAQQYQAADTCRNVGGYITGQNGSVSVSTSGVAHIQNAGCSLLAMSWV